LENYLTNPKFIALTIIWGRSWFRIWYFPKHTILLSMSSHGYVHLSHNVWYLLQLVLRFANRFFLPLWNRDNIDNIQVYFPSKIHGTVLISCNIPIKKINAVRRSSSFKIVAIYSWTCTLTALLISIIFVIITKLNKLDTHITLILKRRKVHLLTG